MDPLASFSLKFDRTVWDKSGVVEQEKLIKEFLRVKDTLPVSDAGQLERSFQRRLSISRDEWFRMLVSTDTERLKLLAIAWEKRNANKQAPSAAGPSSTGHVYPQSGWLGEFVYEYGKKIESPDSFFFWSGVAAISAVVRRHVFVRFGPKHIYPNFYVILVARSGKARKATPIKAAELFTRTIPDINFIERTTTERLPHDLSYSMTNVNGQVQKVPCDALGFMCAEELVAFLDDQSYNSGVMRFLIEWWDCPDRKGVRSLKHGIIELKNIHITLLGGTTPEWLQGALSSLVAGGGMLNRTIFVCEERTPKLIAWPDEPDPNIEQRLKEQLAYIEQVNGQFIVTPQAFEWNESWYKNFRDYLENHDADAPSLERKQIHMIKLAMILALSEGKPLEITPELLERAKVILDKQEEGLPEIARSLVATPMGREHLRILDQIKKAGGQILHSDLLRRNSPYGVDREALEKITKTLEESDQIEIFIDTSRNRNPKVYKLRNYP